MHQQAREFVARTCKPRDVCEFGSYNVNGGIRDLFPDCNYVGVDVRPGPGVDVAADCSKWDGDGRRFDLVVCCEVLEHAALWQEIISTAYRLLRPCGRFICTAAGPNRPKHTCDGKAWSPECGEYYGNIDPNRLRTALEVVGFAEIHVECTGQDVRCLAVKSKNTSS